jgi:predicted small lipoprotein YifL
MSRLKLLLITSFILLLISACGQKGPLYLPDGVESSPTGETEQTGQQKDSEKEKK